MGKIIVIDDDFAAEAVCDCLVARGHDVKRLANATAALDALNDFADVDVIVIDVMMARPEGLPESSTHGGYRTGLIVAQKIREQYPSLPIVIFTGVKYRELREWCENISNVFYVDKAEVANINAFAIQLEEKMGTPAAKKVVRSFIVHGHDEATKLAVKNYLQNVLHLLEPVILHEQPSQGKTLIEKFEHHAQGVDLVFVLLTPDDLGAAATDPDDKKRRARQNVIFELGYFCGQLGRLSGRVLLLHKGPLELPSDISGVVYIDISNGIEAAGENLRRELKAFLST